MASYFQTHDENHYSSIDEDQYANISEILKQSNYKTNIYSMKLGIIKHIINKLISNNELTEVSLYSIFYPYLVVDLDIIDLLKSLLSEIINNYEERIQIFSATKSYMRTSTEYMQNFGDAIEIIERKKFIIIIYRSYKFCD